MKDDRTLNSKSQCEPSKEREFHLPVHISLRHDPGLHPPGKPGKTSEQNSSSQPRGALGRRGAAVN